MRRVATSLIVMILLSGCDQSMTQQRKNNPLTPSELWSDGTSARPLPAHTVALSDLDRDRATTTPPLVSTALLERGRDRFAIFCTPCHGLAGRGDGMIVQRGFPAPPDYASPRLRSAGAQHLFDVITHGYGVMYSYAARVDPADRWAIVAYIRALQLAAGDPPASGKTVVPQ